MAAFAILVGENGEEKKFVRWPKTPGTKKKGRRSWDGSPFGTATANSWRAEAQPLKIES